MRSGGWPAETANQLVFRISLPSSFFFFNDTATTEIYTLSLHDALPISRHPLPRHRRGRAARQPARHLARQVRDRARGFPDPAGGEPSGGDRRADGEGELRGRDA